MYFYFSSSGPVIVSAPVGTAHGFNHSLAPSMKTPLFKECRNLHCMDCSPRVQLQVTRTVSVDQPVLQFLPCLAHRDIFPPTEWWNSLCMNCKRKVQLSATRNQVVLTWLQSPTLQESRDIFPRMECKAESSPLPNMDSGSPVISEHTQNTDSPSNESGTSP